MVSFVTVTVCMGGTSNSQPPNFCCCVWHSNRLFTIITLERCGLEWPSSQVFLLRSANICVRFFSSRSCALLFSPLSTFYSKTPLIFSKQPPPLASTRPKPANLAQLSRASYSFPLRPLLPHSVLKFAQPPSPPSFSILSTSSPTRIPPSTSPVHCTYRKKKRGKKKKTKTGKLERTKNGIKKEKKNRSMRVERIVWALMQSNHSCCLPGGTENRREKERDRKKKKRENGRKEGKKRQKLCEGWVEFVMAGTGEKKRALEVEGTKKYAPPYFP